MLNANALRQNYVVQIPATVLTVAAMVLLPLASHLLPVVGGAPMGARLLPMFFAPLFAALFFHPVVSVVAGLVAPFLNHALTGSPAEPVAALLTIELVAFSLAVQVLFRRFPRFWFTAPLAYLVAKGVSLIVLIVSPFQPVATSAPQSALNSTATAWPGIVLLLIINLLVVKNLHQND